MAGCGVEAIVTNYGDVIIVGIEAIVTNYGDVIIVGIQWGRNKGVVKRWEERGIGRRDGVLSGDVGERVDWGWDWCCCPSGRRVRVEVDRGAW